MALTPDPDFTFGPWTSGDAVVGPALVAYRDDGYPADLTDATVTNGWLADPAGIRYPATVAVDADPSTLAYTLDGDEFTAPGVWTLAADVATGGNRFRTTPASFVVEATDGWLTLAAARDSWRDAPDDDVVLWRLLAMAREQVEAYAPAIQWSTPPPNYVTAQHTQARNIWNAVKTDPANQGIGDEAFTIRPFPMDWTVKQMIRPARAVPVVR